MPHPDPEQRTVAPDGKPAHEQPKWRRDFPIDRPEEEYISRRDLTRFIALTSLAFATGQFWILGQSRLRRPPSYQRLPIARLEDIPIGGSLVFGYPTPEEERVLVRLGEERLVAYDRKCTHLLCPVFPRVEEGVLHCPCHNGYFDLADGRPIAGPPRRPLPLIELEIDGGVVHATNVVLRTT
ncbi:MAG TPA: Rieske (2Fe-2S) protein [Longimicrobiales bacterium]|nr:Rieske (2Fe-2S) protein [Longimicrobiales bacterium]